MFEVHGPAHLRAVEADVAEAYEPSFPAKEKHLEEESLEFLREALAELADGVEIGSGPPDEVDASDIALAEFGQPPRRVGPAHGAAQGRDSTRP